MSLLSTQQPVDVKTFSLNVEDWSSVRAALLLTGDPTEALEAHVLKQLPAGAELIRWAVVRIDAQTDSLFCEGAYQIARSDQDTNRRANASNAVSFADKIGL
jgi:hypothetical protein